MRKFAGKTHTGLLCRDERVSCMTTSRMALQEEFEASSVHVESRRSYFGKWLGKRPPLLWSDWEWAPKKYVTAWIGSFLAILVLGAYDQFGAVSADLRGILGSAGATVVLLFAAPTAPLSQPRNVILGSVISAIIGMGFQYVSVSQPSLRFLAGALACATSIVAMQLTMTVHPPAGATALILATADGVLLASGWLAVLTPVLTGVLIMVLIALAVDNVFLEYPQSWF